MTCAQQKQHLSKIKSMLKSDRFASELLNDDELSDETMKTADDITKTAGDSKKNLKNESFNKKNLKNVSFNAQTKPGTNTPLPPNYSYVESACSALGCPELKIFCAIISRE